MKRNARKGFTLIEIIIVLVILAIIAAASIPTMMGFINDARGKAFITEARSCYVAAQAIAAELLSTNAATPANIALGLDAAGSGSAAPADAEQLKAYTKLKNMMGADVVFGSGAIGTAKVSFTVNDDGIFQVKYQRTIGTNRVAVITVDPSKSVDVQYAASVTP